MTIRENKDGVLLTIFVKPNSSKFTVKIEGDEITVQCNAEPSKGKANKEILKEFSKIFHAKVELVSGAMSRQKRILILGVNKSQAEKFLIQQ